MLINILAFVVIFSLAVLILVLAAFRRIDYAVLSISVLLIVVALFDGIIIRRDLDKCMLTNPYEVCRETVIP